MQLRLAGPSEPDAVSVREYLAEAAERTMTDEDRLFTELDRWSLLHDNGVDLPCLEQRYLREFGAGEETMRARIEGFRQTVGVPPVAFLELLNQAQRRTSDKVWLLDLKVVPVLEESPSP